VLDPSVLVAFVPAALAVVLAPGPDTIYTLTKSLGSGRIAGLAAATGTTAGILVHTNAAVLGLSALLRTSALAYTVVKYVGAAYLVYLGVQLLRNDAAFEVSESHDRGESTPRQAFRRAAVINVSNPKVAVFVLAFFPQFVPATANASVQLSLLGVVYAGLALAYLGCVALFAGRVRHLVVESGTAARAMRYASGSVLVAFGLVLAVEDRPTV
jgi:threonine/homoserine/homoserine lactone efflux protein